MSSRVEPNHLEQTSSRRYSVDMTGDRRRNRRVSIHTTYDETTESLAFEERENTELGDELAAALWKAALVRDDQAADDDSGIRVLEDYEALPNQDAYKNMRRELLMLAVVPPLIALACTSIIPLDEVGVGTN